MSNFQITTPSGLINLILSNSNNMDVTARVSGTQSTVSFKGTTSEKMAKIIDFLYFRQILSIGGGRPVAK